MGLQDPRGAPGEDVPRPVTQPIGRRPLPRNYSAPETLAFCTKGECQMNWAVASIAVRSRSSIAHRWLSGPTI